MKLRLSILLLAAALAASPAAGQTIKSLGYNTTNGQVVYSGTNPLTFTNSLQFATNARAATRTNLGGTTVGDSVFTATNAAAAATAVGLGTANSVTFQSLTAELLQVRVGTNLYVGLADDVSEFWTDVAVNETLSVSGAATFSTNVTVNGNLSVGSFTTTTPSTWALDATQTAAATNGILALPSNANVIRLTNNNAISGVSGGVLGAFYYLVNQTTNAVTISNVGGITVQGGTPLTLGANQAATLVATGATNVSVVNRGQDIEANVFGVALTTNNTTLEDVPGLSIPLAVGPHKISVQVFFSANAAAGSKMAMTFDGTGTPSGQRQTITTSVAQAVAISSFASTSSATASEVAHLRVYTINVTGAGTLKVQGAQNVAGNNSITATGFLKAERL
jgi:hypothetical protein